MSTKPDVSIVIVHTYEKQLLRQTLRGIRRAAPKIHFEVIIVDNNPAAGMGPLLRREFPETVYVMNERNLGFGGAMNVGMKRAQGRYILIFNPDIIVQPGSLEAMTAFMDQHPDIGMCGPRLNDPDGSLQYSCYRQPTTLLPAYRRTSLGNLPFGRRAVETYLMMNENHGEQMDVDSLIGAALFTRRAALEQVGLFDERFFMYYEDNDICRRFWEHGHRVVYFPGAGMTHYHRRASADGNLLQQLFSRYTRIQIASFLKYMRKYWRKPNPREAFFNTHEQSV